MESFLKVFAIMVVGMSPFILFLFGDLISKGISPFWFKLVFSTLFTLPLIISSGVGILALATWAFGGK